MWRDVLVRSAGFPASRVLALATGEAVRELDRLAQLETHVRDARAHAMALAEACDLAVRGRLLRALRNGATLTAVQLPPEAAALRASLDALESAAREYRDGRAICDGVLAQARRRTSQVVREVASDPRFREAIAWQNRTAIRTCLDVVLRRSDEVSNSRARQHDRLIASYLQRYCVKNDTIGFFGPIGWGRIVRTAERPIVARSGTSLVARRTVFFEHWGIDALAQQLAADPSVRVYLPPRRSPTIRLVGATLHHSLGRTTPLPPTIARLLELCDGVRSARAIAQQLTREASDDLASDAEVYELLEQLADKGLIVWTLDVPAQARHPDRELRAALEALEDPEVAAPLLARVAELQDLRDAVARAAGDAAAVDHALSTLEDAFTQQTARAPQRGAGTMYAGRALVFEDCVRALDLTIDPDVFRPVEDALALVFASCRWFTFAIAERYRQTLLHAHRELQRATGSKTVDFIQFLHAASEHFTESDRTAPPLVAEAVRELQERWTRVLRHDEARSAHRLDLASAELAPAVADVFASPHPGWPGARHHAPDLLIAASDLDAIARGELTVVLGEIHPAYVTLSFAAPLHADPDALVAAMLADRPGRGISPVVARHLANRMNIAWGRPRDLDLEFGTGRSFRPREQVIAASELVCEEVQGRLQIRSRDGRHVFELEELFDVQLSHFSSGHFRPFPAVAHLPRITIDGLVIARETWTFEASELDFASIRDPVDRLTAVRRWARAHDLPRFVFYRVPGEIKPFFLDLESITYMEQLAHVARGASQLVVSEMLPAIDQAWLPDAEGARYTCELRMVAVDPEPWQPTQQVTRDRGPGAVETPDPSSD
jgi:hypothetical protein